MKTSDAIKIALALGALYMGYRVSARFKAAVEDARQGLRGSGIPYADFVFSSTEEIQSGASGAVTAITLPYDLANAIGASASGEDDFELVGWLGDFAREVAERAETVELNSET